MVTLKKYSNCQNGKSIRNISANLNITNFSNINNNVNKNISNFKIVKRCKYNSLYVINITYAILIVLTTAFFGSQVRHVQTAAIFLNGDFRVHPRFEPICSPKQEHFVESDGKGSSLILEFKPGNLDEHKISCTRILSAPPNFGFIIRLILPKIRRGQYYHASALTAASSEEQNANNSNDSTNLETTTFNGLTSIIGQLNTTSLKQTTNVGRKCPMSIYSSLDPHSPQWRVDPCQLEDTAPEMEDPVRLFHGRVRIVWEHNNQHLHSKLMVTVLGKGEQCRHGNKHQCLRIGDEPILCIAKELECDGIRHCPVSNEYDSDEDYKMCWKHRRFSETMPPAMESEIFEHFAMEVFRNLFAFDAPQMPEPSLQAPQVLAGNASRVHYTDTNNTEKVLNKFDDNVQTPFVKTSTENTIENSNNNNNNNKNNNNDTVSGNNGGLPGRRNSTRTGLQSDLAKYGPWGYLMLGMLLCGGALLICGLWASASQNAVNNEREAAMQQGTVGGSSSIEQSGNMAPPNYDELDPPPAYAVLFPNQKAASNSTLSSLAAITSSTTTSIMAVPPLSPASTPSSSGISPENQMPAGSQPRISLDGSGSGNNEAPETS